MAAPPFVLLSGAGAGATIGTRSTCMSMGGVLVRPPSRSCRIDSWASWSPQIQEDENKKKMKKGSSNPVLSPAKAIGGDGGGDQVAAAAKAAKAKYKGTQMREKHLTEMIEKMVTEAKEVCAGDETSDECKVAWDEVEEVSQAKADLRLKLEHQQDPLESFCTENPETDECRIYED